MGEPALFRDPGSELQQNKRKDKIYQQRLPIKPEVGVACLFVFASCRFPPRAVWASMVKDRLRGGGGMLKVTSF